MNKSSAQNVESPSQLIDARIKELGDWRGKTLSRLRALIKQADPEVVEEGKWRKASHPGVPVWSHQGPICTGETYKSVEGPFGAVQLKPRRQHPARNRLPRAR